MKKLEHRVIMNCFICRHEMNKEEEWLYTCPSCGFERSLLTPGSGRGVDGLETLRKQNFQIIIGHLKKHRELNILKCLEVGSAEGWFLEAMQAEGVKLKAVEASEQALDLQSRDFDVIHGFFPEALTDDGKYDLIIFNDVFEHLSDPIASLKACENLLGKNGLLILNLPNKNGFIYRLSKIIKRLGIVEPFHRLWQKDFSSPHISYFSDANITRFVDNYSALCLLESYYLPSIIKEGLEERIQSTFSHFIGKLIYYVFVAALPIIKCLPQDIMVYVYTCYPKKSK